MNSIEQCIVERARHEQELQNGLKRLNERKLQIQECKVQKVKASDASSGDNDCSRIVSDKENDQVEKVDSNVTPDSPKCDNEIQTDHNAVECDDERTEFERYKAFNDHTVDYDKLERKLNETLGLLAQKEIDINEGLKVKAYEFSVVKEKHDELVKHSLLTKSHYKGLVKEKTKVIMDLKLKEEKDIDKMISMEK
ncbi:hypothetical protein Tco_0048784 [Tanacetum coccineum]